MADKVLANIPSTTVIAATSITNTNIISLNPATQLPLKLTSSNYPSWRAQFNTLLFGYDLLGYINGSHSSPPITISEDNKKVPNPAYTIWKRQDSLILLAIFALLSNNVIPLISTATTSQEAWDKLSKLYANRSRTRVLQLKDQVSRITKGTQSVSEYLQTIKCIVDELDIIESSISDDNLIVHVLRGLESEFKDIHASIRSRETPVTFEELHDKLVEHEEFSKSQP
ncbi:hypothetical protein EZV62_015366 [Acer yangbiense]|uniref:Uncharacterized protein n=1 Tax=Acer yangbiense TaxID=1000413 RepID=A0A5C7HKI3_9ROSI|nr:hypothetical protein EZV62_015366 [Acer yangbiense]